MKYYTEPSREIPVAAETEVLVVGGGPAGFGAALHAARMGRKTMLIEQYGAVGGVATTGIMSHWTGRQDGGCFEELREKARDCEAEQVINPEKLRILMLDMLMEAGVNVQLYTGFSDVIMEGNRVAGVITESKSGREAILSKMVIDSTGDGDVAARAGVPFEKGRSTDGGMQPMTIMFKVAGVIWIAPCSSGALRIRSSCRKAICKHSVVRNYPLRQVISCCILRRSPALSQST